MNSLLAALQLEAARKRQQAESAASTPAPSAGGAVYQVASYTAPTASLRPAVATTEDADATPSGAGKSDGQHAMLIASANTTSAITPWPDAFANRMAPQLALAYARPTEQETSATTAAARTAPVHVAQAKLPQPQADTTIAMKRAADQTVSTIVASRPSAASDLQGVRFDNPWLDAVLVSPDLRHFMTALMLGAENYRALSKLVEKPTQSVVMTFGPEPNPGLSTDHFTGAAVGVLSTVTYKQVQARLRRHTTLW